MSYREAQEELQLLWKVKVSVGSMQRVTMRHGRIADKLIVDEAAALEAAAPAATAYPEQIVMCTDGAMVQLTTGEWREVKTMSLGEFRPIWDQKQQKVATCTTNISYFSRVAKADVFSRLALVEWHRRGGENTRRVVAVQDGALWIQSVVDYHCPQAIRVIDFAHAQEYVAHVGRAIHGAETKAFQQWYSRMSKQLGQQPPQRTVNALRLLQRQHPNHPEEETIELAIRYLEKRLSMIDYPHFRRQQIPIGSGNVESGHKVVMQRRMKQAGMRWAEENLNPMLALRMALCNDAWRTSWQAIVTQARREKYDSHLPQKVTDPTPQLLTEADCQRMTALAERIVKKQKHPWRDHRWLFPHRSHSIHKK